jgi:hypothetical protein
MNSDIKNQKFNSETIIKEKNNLSEEKVMIDEKSS